MTGHPPVDAPALEPENESGQAKPERGSALFKALSVLEVAFREARPVGLSEIAGQLGLPRQSVHRTLQQLEDNGLLLRDATRERYVVGPRMTRLALAALDAAKHTAPTRAILEALVAELGETCNIGVLDGRAVVYIDRVECDWPLRLQLQAGSHVPLHCTSIGKLLLAHLSRAQRRRLLTAAALPRYTANTITDPEALEQQLAQIRQDGYATNDQELNEGVVSLAVPILADNGKPIAGLAVHAPEVRMSLAQGMAHLPKLRETAARLAEAWGLGE